MHEGDVNAVNPESLQTVFNGSSHARRRVIVDDVVRRRRKRKILLIFRGLRCLKKLTDLRGEDEFTSILVVKEVAVSTLCQAESVPRSHVIVANPSIPCGFDGGIRIFVGDDCKFIPEWNPSYSEPEGRLVVLLIVPADGPLHAVIHL